MELKSLKKDELIALCEQLQAEDTNKVVADLQNALAERDARIAELEASPKEGDSAEYERTISNLTKRIADLEGTKGNVIPLVTSGGKTYQPLGAIMVAGIRHSVADILANQTLIDEQVKKGNKMFKLVS
jgi:hypothetical protein